MNQQYQDTLHLAISVSTTSSHFLLQFSSPTPFSHSILPFSSSVFSFRSLLFILLSSIPLFHLPYRLSFCLPSCLPFQSVSYKSDKHTENKNPTTICLLQTEGYSTLFSTYPSVSVFRTSAEHSENKSHTGFPLLQTAGGGHQSVKSHLASKYWKTRRWTDLRITDWGVQTLFSAIYPLCLFSAPPRIILKTRAIPDSLSYRLQEEAISL